MKKIYALFLLFPLSAFAAGGIQQTSEILATNQPLNTTCVRNAFLGALTDNTDKISMDAPESEVKQWIYDTFQSAETLGEVLACPEIVEADEFDTIRFMPIEYVFPNGRQIVVNYETQPKVLEQHFMLATKAELPTDDPNPEVSPYDETATWTNTDPAWYGIMVVQHGALQNFVGPDKNNTVSMEYIDDNINKLYPRDMAGMCSTRSGIHARLRNSMVHKVMREYTAKHPDDDNNYYIAGDINLHWISFAEIALDIALTVVSWGGYAAASWGVKMARAMRTLGTIGKNLKRLTRIESVQKYVRASLKVAQYTKEIDNVNDMAKYIRNIDKLEQALAKTTKGTKQYENLVKELEAARRLKAENMWKFGKTGTTTTKTMTQVQAKRLTKIEDKIRKIESIDESRRTADDALRLKKLRQEKNTILNKVGTKDPTEIARLKQRAMNGEQVVDDISLAQLEELQKARLKDIEETQKTMSQMAKEDKNVAEYTKQFDKLKEVNKYVKELKSYKKARTGNMVSRAWQGLKNAGKSYRAAHTGGKTLDKATKVARQGAKSGRVRDWLFHSTMRNAGRLAKIGEELAALHFVLGILGDFYDWTNTETDEFTNGINMKPLLLLSADNIEGQDNVVNYGMWLMWSGDSASAEDDDAAYLQAMDFAQKFYQDLNETQEADNRHACDVDIYVVRPIIRNPGRESQALYWLFMNDEPWTTAVAR